MHRTFALRLLASLLLITGVIAGPVEAARTDPAGGTGGGPIAGSLQVQVLASDTGLPFAGAFVMVGPRPGTPFPGNTGYTSASGEIVFAHPDLIGPVTVTAGASGYAYFTIVSVNANDLVLPLRPMADNAPTYQVGDYVSGIDVNNGSFNLGDGFIDLALVVPCLGLDSFLTFDLQSLIGPPEIIEILGEPVEVPSNIFLPSQYEILVQIIKDHYYLNLAAGSYTLAAVSGRVPRDALLNAVDITEIIPLTQWREIDILNTVISGDTNGADLFVDPDLTSTVTLNLANLPDNTVSWCFSVGDLDNLDGLGRLVPLGTTSYSCPAGSGPCSGAVQLTTTAASGEFTGMSYFPAVAVDFQASEDVLVLLRRGSHPQTYTEQMNSFFQPLDLGYATGQFSWNDAENPPQATPPVHLNLARLTSGEEIYWEFLLSGATTSFEAPGLPPGAPPGPQIGGIYRWEHLAAGLGFDLPSFDFNAFAFSDLQAHASHLASDQVDVTFVGDPATAPESPLLAAGPPRGAGHPNPFHRRTMIRFSLPQAGTAELSVHHPSGRTVATLERGWLEAGPHEIAWDGTDDQGRPLPSGVYLARLSTDQGAGSWRLVLRK